MQFETKNDFLVNSPKTNFPEKIIKTVSSTMIYVMPNNRPATDHIHSL